MYIRKITLCIFMISTAFLAGTPLALAQMSGLSNVSENWAGYVATGSSYTAIHGTWTVPTVTVSQNVGGDATWIGIGGVTSNDLIQLGTEALIQNGQVQYHAWVETLPQGEQDLAMTINPGDSMSASLIETQSGVWQVSISDNTSGQNYTATVNYTSSNSSAEWIEEMPAAEASVRRADIVNLIPLDNFGTVQFSNAGVTANGNAVNISGSGAQALDMIERSGQPLATPSSLGSDDASFSVSRKNPSAAVQPAMNQIYPQPRIYMERGGRGMRRTGTGRMREIIISTSF